MINISAEGIGGALETLKDIIIPWRRKNGQRKANLENALSQANIQKTNGEALILHAKAEREKAALETDRKQAELLVAQAKKTEAEAALIFAQAQKALAEVEVERATLKRSQIELAMQIIDHYSPATSGVQRIDYITKLLPIVECLTTSELGILALKTSPNAK